MSVKDKKSVAVIAAIAAVMWLISQSETSGKSTGKARPNGNTLSHPCHEGPWLGYTTDKYL
jgi:hypothetical protein